MRKVTDTPRLLENLGWKVVCLIVRNVIQYTYAAAWYPLGTVVLVLCAHDCPCGYTCCASIRWSYNQLDIGAMLVVDSSQTGPQKLFESWRVPETTHKNYLVYISVVGPGMFDLSEHQTLNNLQRLVEYCLQVFTGRYISVRYSLTCRMPSLTS
jgi:hypothetical protein